MGKYDHIPNALVCGRDRKHGYDESLPTLLAKLAFRGVGQLFKFGETTTTNKAPVKCGYYSSNSDEYWYLSAKAAILEAQNRIEEGGGLGNQDEDLLRGLEDLLEASRYADDSAGVAQTIVSQANELGHSTERLF